jgi:hypothetical protein
MTRSTLAFVLACACFAGAVSACSSTSEGAPDGSVQDASVPTKFPAKLSAVNGSWTRVGGMGTVEPGLSSQEIIETLTTREPLEQSFTVLEGKGTAVNDGQGPDSGVSTWCHGDREITFSIEPDGVWSVVEGDPRITDLGGQPQEVCEQGIGYGIFAHKPLRLERVERVGLTKLVIAFAFEQGPYKGKLGAHVFELTLPDGG